MMRCAKLVGCCLVLATVTSAQGAQLITNGGFETGTFAGWTVTDLAPGSGTFSIAPNDGVSPSPISGVGGPLALNPSGGSFFAVADQTGPGTHALTQSFVVAPGSSVALTFDMFMNDYSSINPTVDPAGLDHTVGASNQHARIDILTAGAAPFSTAAADIVTSILAPVPAPAIVGGINPWVSSPRVRSHSVRGWRRHIPNSFRGNRQLRKPDPGC
jgi:hypothetical protein